MHFFLRTRDLLVSQKTTQRQFVSTRHPLSTVIFATATVLAFVLLRDSRFSFHCYTLREATPTEKSARKCAGTSRDFLCERLQSAFNLANQLRQIAHFNMFKQPKHRLKMAVLVLLLLTEATAEEKKNDLWAATHTGHIYNITNPVRIYNKVPDMSRANLFLLLTGKALKSKPT